jgi:hypothetical protein
MVIVKSWRALSYVFCWYIQCVIILKARVFRWYALLLCRGIAAKPFLDIETVCQYFGGTFCSINQDVLAYISFNETSAARATTEVV